MELHLLYLREVDVMGSFRYCNTVSGWDVTSFTRLTGELLLNQRAASGAWTSWAAAATAARWVGCIMVSVGGTVVWAASASAAQWDSGGPWHPLRDFSAQGTLEFRQARRQ